MSWLLTYALRKEALWTPARPAVMTATAKRRSGAHKSKQATKDRTRPTADGGKAQPGGCRVAAAPVSRPAMIAAQNHRIRPQNLFPTGITGPFVTLTEQG
jgi:hypothetical protein